MSEVIATVAEGNLASQRVLAKAGMQLCDRRANDDASITLVFTWSPPA
jgi:RimJ/RimL family protein N-acetyltransferase